MEVEPLGAAQTVTGSMHMVHAPRARVLLDCGLFQGRRGDARKRNRELPFRASELSAVVLSHAHIDHSGLLPMLYKSGYQGEVYCTPATRDLCAAMLEDAAMIQANDARFINRQIERGELPGEPVEPLYDSDDVVRLLERMVPIPYRRRTAIAPGVEVTLLDAGHVLGSAIVVLDVDDVGQNRRVVFTGDLGRYNMPILRDPEIPPNANFLMMESTYGDRLHAPRELMDDALHEVVVRTVERGGKVVIPSFALERAQEIIYALKRLRQAGRLPKIPVYVDSPLTVALTDVFKMHPDCYDKETRKLLRGGDSPFRFEGLTYTRSVEESKQISGSSAPAIIISASGMCEGGRILHHLKSVVESKKNTIVIVGWQAPHTLGRRLVERRQRVPIFGVQRDRLCDVVVLNGFSAHADQADLIGFAEAVRERGPLARVALIHGEPKAQEVLKDKLLEREFTEVLIPEAGDRLPV